MLSLKDPYHLLGTTLSEKYRLDALIGIGEALITVGALAFIGTARRDLFDLRDAVRPSA